MITHYTLVSRYINMDFFFFSGLRQTAIKSIVALYDIACQWSKKFWTRMAATFPESWRINMSEVNIRFLIPKFHLPAHIESCHQSFSFNYACFVGRTDGEAPERGWADLDGLACSTAAHMRWALVRNRIQLRTIWVTGTGKRLCLWASFNYELTRSTKTKTETS